MQEQPSAGRPFKSRFGGGFISGCQYLAENMCARVARKDRVELQDRFWESEKWLNEFRLQTVHASRLLKDYSVEAIIAALRTTRGKQLYSLGLKKVLVPLIKEEQERLDRQKVLAEMKARQEAERKAQEPPTPPEPSGPQTPRQNFVGGKPSLLSKLRGM